MRADVRDPKQVKAFVDATVTKYGRLDIAFTMLVFPIHTKKSKI